MEAISETIDASALERCIRIAFDAHLGQRDKTGDPFVLHPLGVMCAVEGFESKCAAVLHDVLEDRPDIGPGDLRSNGVPERVVELVEILTRRAGETYDDYLTRVLRDPVAVRIKRADLTNNSSPQRMRRLKTADAERLARKYAHGFDALRGS